MDDKCDCVFGDKKYDAHPMTDGRYIGFRPVLATETLPGGLVMTLYGGYESYFVGHSIKIEHPLLSVVVVDNGNHCTHDTAKRALELIKEKLGEFYGHKS